MKEAGKGGRFINKRSGTKTKQQQPTNTDNHIYEPSSFSVVLHLWTFFLFPFLHLWTFFLFPFLHLWTFFLPASCNYEPYSCSRRGETTRGTAKSPVAQPSPKPVQKSTSAYAKRTARKRRAIMCFLKYSTTNYMLNINKSINYSKLIGMQLH